MRRIRKIKSLKSKQLLRARLLKLNYILTKRAFRKSFFKKKIINYGLLKIGGPLVKNFYKFLHTSFYFTYFINNSITISIFPSLYNLKSTNSAPKYPFIKHKLLAVQGKQLIKSLLLNNASLSSGTNFYLFTNMLNISQYKNTFEIKGCFYQYNYIFTLGLVKSTIYSQFLTQYLNYKIQQVYNSKSLLQLFFFI